MIVSSLLIPMAALRAAAPKADDTTTSLVIAGLIVFFLFTLGLGLLLKRAKTLADEQDREAREFEMRLQRETRATRATSSPAYPQPPPMPAPGAETGSREAGRTATPEAPSAPAPGAFTAEVIRRLQAANAYEGSDGPVRCANPGLSGEILLLRGGKRVAVIEDAHVIYFPELAAVLRHLDGAILPGTDREPLYMKRFDQFMAGLVGM